MKSLVCSFVSSMFLLNIAPIDAQIYTVKKLADYPLAPLSINRHGHVAGFGKLPANHGNATGFYWSETMGVIGLKKLESPCVLDFCSKATMLNDIDEIIGISTWQGGLNCIVWPGPAQQSGRFQFYGPATCLHVNDKMTVIATGVGDPRRPPGAFYFAPESYCCVTLLPPNLHWAGFNNNDTGLVYVDNPARGIPDIAYWTVAGGLGAITNINSASSNTILDFSDKGQAVIEGTNVVGPGPLFLWDPVTGTQMIPRLSPADPPPLGVATGVVLNNLSQVAGTMPWGIFVWTPSTGTQDLNKLIPGNLGITLAAATGLNDAGQISAYALVGRSQSNEDLNTRGYILSPRMNVALSSSGPAIRKGKVTLTATISSVLGYVPKDGEIITFTSGTKVIATTALNKGVATVNVSLSKGEHHLQALYPGNWQYEGSASPTMIRIVR